MTGLLDEFAMRDMLAQQQAGPSLPQRIMQIMQQRARITAQRLGIPYQQALEAEMRRSMQQGRGIGAPVGQPAIRAPQPLQMVQPPMRRG